MDSWLFNKIAGALLAALLVAFGAGTLADIIGSGHGHNEHAKPGFALPVTDVASSGAKAPAAEAFKFDDIAGLLKTASPEDGKATFAACRACHTAEKDGKPLVGPNLYGIVGREVASSPSFPRYSTAMKGHKGQWTLDQLAPYLHDPRAAVPGNQMAFAGVKDNNALANLLMYLRSLSDSPVPLPN